MFILKREYSKQCVAFNIFNKIWRWHPSILLITKVSNSSRAGDIVSVANPIDLDNRTPWEDWPLSWLSSRSLCYSNHYILSYLTHHFVRQLNNLQSLSFNFGRRFVWKRFDVIQRSIDFQANKLTSIDCLRKQPASWLSIDYFETSSVMNLQSRTEFTQSVRSIHSFFCGVSEFLFFWFFTERLYTRMLWIQESAFTPVQ